MILPLLACLTLVGASSAPLAVSSLPYGNEPLPQCVVYDDVAFEINFTADELNNYTFNNLSTAVVPLVDSLGSDSHILCEIDGTTYEFHADDINENYLMYMTNSGMAIQFTSSTTEQFPLGSWAFTNETSQETSFTFSIDWCLNGDVYSTIKTAIQADIEANTQGMSGVEVVGEIVDILVGGLVSLGSGIGAGVANFASALAFQDGELSVYFVLIVVFAAVSLAIGLTRHVFRMLSSMGGDR